MKLPARYRVSLLALSSIFLAGESQWLPAAERAGWRTGLDVTIEASASVKGGSHRGESLHGLALAHVDWHQAENFDRGWQWRGYASVLTLAGHGPTERFAGDFLALSNCEGAPGTRLYSWWLETAAAGWSLRGGALLADEEFAGTVVGGNFFNSSFGWPAFVSANTVNTGPAFFIPAPGLRLQGPMGEKATWRLGVYDGDAFDSPAGDPAGNRHGLHYGLGGAQGWFAITEVAVDFGPLRVKTGSWLHTAQFADVRDDAGGTPFAVSQAAPRVHARNYGAYAAIEQTLVGEPGKAGSVEAHARAGFSPADRNPLGWAADLGLAWTGPLPGRAGDVAALGFARGNFSPRFADNARLADPTSPVPDYEQVVELNYRWKLSEAISLQPDCQYVCHPGGCTARRDAVVFQFRVNASF